MAGSEEASQRLFPIEAYFMKKLMVPKFASDDEEAQWWYDHKRIVEDNLSEALRNGTAGRGIVQRVLNRARQAEPLTLPAGDLERAIRLSRRKKIECREYILGLLHKALDREEAAAKRAQRRKSA